MTSRLLEHGGHDDKQSNMRRVCRLIVILGRCDGEPVMVKP
jgi:hypothetical protein